MAILTLPLTSPAQTPRARAKVWHIGLFHVGLDHVPPSVPALRQTLAELGYEDGKNIRFDFRNQKDEEAARRTAHDFTRERVDLIVAVENQALRAAVAAKTDTTILFLHVLDPIGGGFVRSLARPGGNITGFASPELIAKRLELFKEAHPNLRRVLSLANSKDPTSDPQLAVARRAAQALGLVLVERTVSTLAETERVYRALQPGEVDGVLVVASSLRTTFSNALIRLSVEHRLPIVGHRREWAERGALLSYGDDFAAVGRAAASYVDKLLRGAAPADLPVDERSGILLTVNLRTAKALGITVPPSIITRANEVIE
ncbi:MAG TPA: ABC transporter substrate-binding protein [Methylomirabilota bacterium]|nr:ABC transporter substrate-binding protein [Methylomirabilota bacterium]